MGRGSSGVAHGSYAIRDGHALGPRTQPRVRPVAAAMAGVDGRSAVRHGQEDNRRRNDGDNDERSDGRTRGARVVVETQTGNTTRPTWKRP